jgi:hypothetical protein
MTIDSSRVPKHFSLRGEWVELRFMACAAQYDIRAIRPSGDCCRYDFIVEIGGQFRRVQVKSTSYRRKNHYQCSLSGAKRRAYTKDEVDFFALFVIPADTWYIIPIEALCDKAHNISLSPHNSLSKYAEYREAWHLLRGEEKKPD